MELRHAVQFASRTAPSRFWAGSSSPCLTRPSTAYIRTCLPSRTFSTTRAVSAADDSSKPDLLSSLQSGPKQTTRRGPTSSTPNTFLPPRPPPATKPSWTDPRRPPPATSAAPPAPAASAAAPKPGSADPYLDDMAMLPDLISWDINEFRSANSKLLRPGGGTAPAPLEMRNLRPSTGRTVEKYGSVDVARAFQLLDMAVNKNKVRRDVKLQRFHERPGLKRKRQRSERWRNLFKQSFRHTVSRVAQLKKQGW